MGSGQKSSCPMQWVVALGLRRRKTQRKGFEIFQKGCYSPDLFPNTLHRKCIKFAPNNLLPCHQFDQILISS